MNERDTARKILKDWRGDAYAFGLDVLGAAGEMAARFGRRALLVANESPWSAAAVDVVASALYFEQVDIVAREIGARPNAPLQDARRLRTAVEATRPEVVVCVGGGSTIDAAKAALALAAVAPGSDDFEPLFGVGEVTRRLTRAPVPLVAVATAASSGSHLTKYSNLTDPATAQKKLIVDDALVCRAAVFDYAVTASAPAHLTADGAFDGMSHCIEVYFGAAAAALDAIEPAALAGVGIIVDAVRASMRAPDDLCAREGLGLGTDLGAFAIMHGSTSGPHLASFSLVDCATHGRATGILTPYYAVLFAPAIERQLSRLAAIYRRAGLLQTDVSVLRGRDLALAVADAMTALSRGLGMPTSLGKLGDFTGEHVDRAINAARNPQLRMKLAAMPIPMEISMLDDYMRPCLEAAAAGDLERVVTLPG